MNAANSQSSKPERGTIPLAGTFGDATRLAGFLDLLVHVMRSLAYMHIVSATGMRRFVGPCGISNTLA